MRNELDRVALAAVGLLLAATGARGATPSERIAHDARVASPGTYARSWSGEPLYWTVLGTPDGDRAALLSEDGALEPAKGGFSLEPFVWVNGSRVAARDVQRIQLLEEGDLPIPSVLWEHPLFRLRVRAFAATDASAYASYRLENPSAEARAVELWLVLRPMQVLPAWQSLNLTPGFAPIRDLDGDGTMVRVDGQRALWPLSRPDRFGVARGDMRAPLEHHALPLARAAHADDGFSGGVLAWRVKLPPHGAHEIHVRVALGTDLAPIPTPADGGAQLVSDALAAAIADWRAQLDRVEIALPEVASDVQRTLRTALAHMLVNRDGPRLQPGSRNYARSWIRDGAISSSVLLELGHAEAAREFLAWYAGFQLDDGALPCCVDARGADPTPEHDSTGAFLYALAEYARHTRDVAFVRSLWPRVVRAVGRLEALRSEQLDPRWRTELGGAAFGILPESISHEGYAKKAVHSYWDDLFGRQGLRDAVLLAELTGDEEHRRAWAELRDAFEADLSASLSAVRRLRGIAYLPGSIELGDLDPTATAVGFELGGELRDFPEAALRATFAPYLDEVAQRQLGVMKRDAFTPYEMRIANALIRMGEREAAWKVIGLNLAGRRPAQGRREGWNQWPEIVWTDETQGRWLGDLPHGWVGSTFIHAVRTALVYERGSDQTLVLGAGVPAAWLESGAPLRVARLSTWWGPVDYELLRTESGVLRVHVGGGLTLPPGGVVVAPPGADPVGVRSLPADLEIRPISERYE
jgi:hypothetical protein